MVLQKRHQRTQGRAEKPNHPLDRTSKMKTQRMSVLAAFASAALCVAIAKTRVYVRRLERLERALEAATAAAEPEKGVASTGAGECLAEVEREVGGLPREWVVLRNQGVSLMVHDPKVEFISQFAYDKGWWWGWGLMDEVIRAVGNYTEGIFLEVGSNIGTVSMRFASAGIPVLTVEANPVNYVRVRASRCLNDIPRRDYVVVNRAVSTNEMGPGLYVSGWERNQGTTYTSTKKEEGDNRQVQIKPVTVDSLAYGQGSMAKYDYAGLDLTLPVWAMKIDCEGCEGAAVQSARRLLHDPKRHPLALHVEVTPDHLERAGTSMDVLYAELKAAGYSHFQGCLQYDRDKIDPEWRANLTRSFQMECVFIKRRQA